MSAQLLMLMLAGTLQWHTTHARDGMRLEPVLQPDPHFQFNSQFSQNAFQNSNTKLGSNFFQDTNQASNFPSSNNVFQRQSGGFPTLPPRRDSFPTLPPRKDSFPALPPRKSVFPTLSARQPQGPINLPPAQPQTLPTLSNNQPTPSQCPADCYKGWTKSNMERPPQLDHMFGSCEKKNETIEEEDSSWGGQWGSAWDVVSGSKPENEVLVGVEPQCSNGRCWCPLLHICDTNTGRCVNKDSVFEDCNDNQFKCTNGKCIEGHLRCDGLSNCLDGSDEIECYQHTCLSHQHRCDDGICVNYHENVMCNSVLDCFDGSDEDEAICNVPQECSSNQFQCIETGRCIFERYQCDGFPDCKDASDELDCTANCSATQWQCADGLSCIPEWKKCDYNHDCPDGSDEKSCIMCTIDQFTCANSTVKCVPKDSVCNYEWDCDDGSDEFNCKNANRGGNLDWIVDMLISEFNIRFNRLIPTNSEIEIFANELSESIVENLKKDNKAADYLLCGFDFSNAIIMIGKGNILRRKDEAWLHVENKEITIKAKIATNRITAKIGANICLNWLPDLGGIVGVEADVFEVSVDVKMVTENCAKPRVHDIKVTGNLRPIYHLHGTALLVESAASVYGDFDLNKFLRDKLNTVVSDLKRDLPSKVKDAFNRIAEKIGENTCIGKPVSNLADKTEAKINETVGCMLTEIRNKGITAFDWTLLKKTCLPYA